MIGVLVNVAAVVVGGLIGLLFRKGIPERLGEIMIKIVGLCVLYLGITGIVAARPDGVDGGKFTLVLIGSMVIGGATGTLLKIEERFSSFTKTIEDRFYKGDGTTSLAEGFISASLLFCVGAMTIVGSLEAGIKGDNTTLFAKSLLDFICAIMMASTLGAGVVFSGLFVLVFQGGIALLGTVLEPLLSTVTVAMISAVGSLLLIAISLNMMGITKYKVMNLMPAVFLPLVLCLLL